MFASVRNLANRLFSRRQHTAEQVPTVTELAQSQEFNRAAARAARRAQSRTKRRWLLRIGTPWHTGLFHRVLLAATPQQAERLAEEVSTYSRCSEDTRRKIRKALDRRLGSANGFKPAVRVG